jgi:hypothetical protein
VGSGGKPTLGSRKLFDAKVGFCFYDYNRLLETGPANAVYSRHSCGHTTSDTAIGMGLSPGWVDDYAYVLPGQSVDVTGVSDGRYRLYTRVDEPGWFREATRRNDTSWAEIALSTTAAGMRVVRITNPGPAIQPAS